MCPDDEVTALHDIWEDWHACWECEFSGIDFLKGCFSSRICWKMIDARNLIRREYEAFSTAFYQFLYICSDFQWCCGGNKLIEWSIFEKGKIMKNPLCDAFCGFLIFTLDDDFYPCMKELF
jgi:hypothetical protein